MNSLLYVSHRAILAYLLAFLEFLDLLMSLGGTARYCSAAGGVHGWETRHDYN